MKLLLDTQSLLWWYSDDPRLRTQVRALIADARSVVLVSVASFWELSIKHRIGKLDARGSTTLRQAEADGMKIVSLDARHLALLEEFAFKPEHKDPFDHVILVQAIVEQAVLVTSDRELRSYGVRCL